MLHIIFHLYSYILDRTIFGWNSNFLMKNGKIKNGYYISAYLLSSVISWVNLTSTLINMIQLKLSHQLIISLFSNDIKTLESRWTSTPWVTLSWLTFYPFQVGYNYHSMIIDHLALKFWLRGMVFVSLLTGSLENGMGWSLFPLWKLNKWIIN